MFSGILLIVLNLLVEEEKETAWIDGFAILCSCTVVIGVTALNDYKKEKEFQRLNDAAEKGKKVILVRDGQEIDDMKLEDVVVGDIMILKAG